MKNFRELSVYRDGVDLVCELYEVTATFPDHEKYGLVSQIRRASVSIPTNLAEGWGRPTLKQKLYFYDIARASSREVDCLLEITTRLNLANVTTPQKHLARIQFKLTRLINALQ